MKRTRAWRRYKDYTKAKRKRDIDIEVSWYPTFWPGFSDGERVFPKRGLYNNLHQYSKNKIHCSCPDCSPKTRNKGRRKRNNYAPSINYSMMDLKKQQSMNDDEKENNEMKYVRFWGGNGYCGCDYEEYEKFEDEVTEEEINEYSSEIGYENAETYEWVVHEDDSDFEFEEDREEYYEDALSYCGWEYCTEEDFLENTEGE